MNEEPTYLSFNEYKAKARLSRYVSRLAAVYEPHGHAVRARRGMGIQKALRGLGTKSKELWKASIAATVARLRSR